jgi:cephalosporin hydroxylase
MMKKPVIRVIVCTKNEIDLIEPFLQYYGYLFGFENITVVDNDSNHQSVLQVYEKYKPLGIEVINEPAPFDYVHQFMTKHVNDACKKCDWLLTLETDEFLFWIPSMADVNSVVDPTIVYEYLASVPDEISVLRYKHVMQSCVKTTDEHYIDNRYDDPVAQMKYFANQVFYKNIIRARDFSRVTMWSHDVDMVSGSLIICPVMGLLHYHNTGESMLQLRTQELVKGYGFNFPNEAIEAKIAYCAWLKKNIPNMTGGHRLEYFQRFLRRSYVLHFFNSIVGRLPSVSEMYKLTEHEDDLSAILIDIMSVIKGKVSVNKEDKCMTSYKFEGHSLPSDYQETTSYMSLMFHETSMEHEFVIMQGINTLALARKATSTPQLSFYDIIEKYSYRQGVQFGTDKMSMHSYFDTYDSLLSKLRSRSGVKILENGIQTGAFLRTLAEYLPQAEIYGVDITLDELKYCNANDPRIHLYEMDGTLSSTAMHIGEYFDVIIEDASHIPEHQVASLDAFAPYIKEDGIYIIEDINGAYVEYLQEKLATIATKHGLTMEWKDMRKKTGLFDDIMVIFKRVAAPS